ncbi:MAG TPA: hypothetical protein PKE64_09325 [Anaerolineae bacterium]|nr:hypothetical protein [Anaerolineae bacterium]
MVTASRLLTEPTPQWLTAAPLWEPYAAIEQRHRVRQPALLRFTADTFMDDFITVVTTSPARLGEWSVTPETWRRPAPVPSLPNQTNGLGQPSAAAVLSGATADPELAGERLKLYMPAHQRYYLVTANLVCRLPGLPDKRLDFSQNERVSFVLRRLMQAVGEDQIREHAFVQGRWQVVEAGDEQRLVSGEAQQPLFPITYPEFKGRARRLFAGLVPVSGREAYLTAGRQIEPAASAGSEANPEARLAQLQTVLAIDVLEPWRAINQLWAREDAALVSSWTEIGSDTTERGRLATTANKSRDKLQTASWYGLLDLASFLQDYLPDVWSRIESNPTGSVPNGTPGRALIEALQDASFKPETGTDINNLDIQRNKLRGRNETSGATTLAQALSQLEADRTDLELATAGYVQGEPGWPATKFLLCGQRVKALVDDLADLVAEALAAAPPDPAQRIPLTPLAQEISASIDETDYANNLFVIRCVFERPNCPPSVRPAIVSEPTESFEMASYFDPDAPARPIRIPLPVDTSPAGLRKFAKNTMFVLSDTLACQVEAARQITLGDLVLSVLPWPFHQDLPDPGVAGCEDGQGTFGMLCTLSIPIITICALILLIIIVFVLDIIFKWVPYLIFCLPLPGLKAKGSSS